MVRGTAGGQEPFFSLRACALRACCALPFRSPLTRCVIVVAFRVGFRGGSAVQCVRAHWRWAAARLGPEVW